MLHLVEYYRTVCTSEDSVHHVAVSGQEHDVVQSFPGQIGVGVLAIPVPVIEIARARSEIRTEDIPGWNKFAMNINKILLRHTKREIG